VKLNSVGDFSENPLEFGARGLSAIFTSKAIDLVRVLRMIEISYPFLILGVILHYESSKCACYLFIGIDD